MVRLCEGLLVFMWCWVGSYAGLGKAGRFALSEVTKNGIGMGWPMSK